MNIKEYIQFECLEVNQPIGLFYVGVINFDDLEIISFADVRRLELGVEEREVEKYIGIQRPLSPNRVKDIKKYVGLVDATFPTGVILAISSEHAKYDPEKKSMKITYEENVAKVLDGQHRIAGLADLNKPGSSFQINATIFIDMELEDQAIIFSTINITQTKVNKSLVADLFEFANSRSPQKTAHNVVRALNLQKGSPFENKIKILGSANDSLMETITQSTFVESLLKYISRDPVIDRDLYKRNKRPEKIKDLAEQRNLFLRNWFIEDQDWKIAKLVENYFNAVGKKWPIAWYQVRPEFILNKSTGFISLMRFLKNAYGFFEKPNEIITEDQFSSLFEKIQLTDSDFNKNKYIPGSSGQKDLYNDLLFQTGLI